jgi:superfamily I DNA and/or RNA helicase
VCHDDGLDSSILGRRRFDLAVLDESSQAVEPACWIPVLRSERVVLAGDHLQLPPTIVSEEAAREGLNVSLQERLIADCGPTIARRLTVQYRMNQAIMEFSSEELYEGTLVADASVREHVLAGLPGVTANELTTRPLELIDTAGASYDEELEPGGESRRNPQEAEVIVRRVQALLEAGVKARSSR